ncbi:MAG TPA: alpha/beta hydrolase [Burkholderiales bacterium]|jgi:pimeloyl-ACP methyl ester carboxylesterase
MRRAILLLLAALATTLCGCASLFQSPAEEADVLARGAGFVPQPAGRFVRMYLKAPGAPVDTLTIYIEGDGARWRMPNLPPADPTPENPLSLKLAIRDPAPAVAYIGRPCQYLDEDTLNDCDPALWTRGRYSPEALAMMRAAVDDLVRTTRARHVTLIGHSGGGAMAALLAEERKDVACLVSVASPLDIDAWVKAIDVSPLRTSINPSDRAGRLRKVPQVHFTGSKDDVVPPATIARFLRAVPQAREERIEGFDHDCCWVDQWVKLRARACVPAGGSGP